MALSEQAVRDRLAVACPPNLDPTLDANDLDAMVRAAREADADGWPPDDLQPWRPGVAYTIGQLIVPVERDGFSYRVQNVSGAGVSGTTEPNWPVSGTVTDNQVTWTPGGLAPWTPTWSINRGAARGWRIKAGKAAHQYSFSAGTDRHDTNQLLEHCLRMAREYEGAGVASLTTLDRSDAAAWSGLLP